VARLRDYLEWKAEVVARLRDYLEWKAEVVAAGPGSCWVGDAVS
jgi:hypothetical protein